MTSNSEGTTMKNDAEFLLNLQKISNILFPPFSKSFNARFPCLVFLVDRKNTRRNVEMLEMFIPFNVNFLALELYRFGTFKNFIMIWFHIQRSLRCVQEIVWIRNFQISPILSTIEPHVDVIYSRNASRTFPPFVRKKIVWISTRFFFFLFHLRMIIEQSNHETRRRIRVRSCDFARWERKAHNFCLPNKSLMTSNIFLCFLRIYCVILYFNFLHFLLLLLSFNAGNK